MLARLISTPHPSDTAAPSRRHVSRRRQAERGLRASEAKLRSLHDNMLAGLITVGAGGVIESVNPAAERIFGYASGELVGRHLAILLPELAARDLRGYLERVVKKSLGRAAEWPGRRKNGDIFPLGLSIFQFGPPEEKLYAGIMRDLSERREVDRLKNEFVSSVSPELRTPLTSIHGSLGLLAAGAMGELPAEAQELVEVAGRNCVRLIGLINDLLDLDKLASGQMEMAKAPVLLASVLRRSLESVQGFAAAGGITIEMTAGAGVQVLGDRDRLVQVAINLLSNAIKFSPRGGTVRVWTEETPGSVEVKMRDRGRAFPSSSRRRSSSASSRFSRPTRGTKGGPASGWRSARRSSRGTRARSGSRAPLAKAARSGSGYRLCPPSPRLRRLPGLLRSPRLPRSPRLSRLPRQLPLRREESNENAPDRRRPGHPPLSEQVRAALGIA